MKLTTLLILAAASLVAACASGDAPRPAAVSKLPPMPQPADNPATPAKVALGKQLFAEARLSGSGKMACQSCHVRDLGWTDAMVLSRKDDSNLNARHTPTLYNVGYQTAWYWDGRATSLEAQILAAWRAQIGADPAKATAVINAVPGYRSQFIAVWDAEATPDTIVKSLGAFFRTFVSTDSPWDRYEAGDVNAVSKDAIAGQALFAGKGRCSTCHAPPFYGNSTFFNIGLEQGKDKPDPGRFNVTKQEADRGAFKTPTLRSVAISAPYFHDGSVATLKDAVRYMAGGGKPDANKSAALLPTGLSEAEIDQIVAFLNSLTSTETWEQPKLP
jgi:cytochrome c peroxidase